MRAFLLTLAMGIISASRPAVAPSLCARHSVSEPRRAPDLGQVLPAPAPSHLRLRGGGMWTDFLVSVLVMLAVTAAAHSGSTILAAIFVTAPTGLPLSLWILRRAAESSAAGGSLVDPFLVSCIKGSLALACFCMGALTLVRCAGDGRAAPSLAMLLAGGYGSWAAAWLLLGLMPA